MSAGHSVDSLANSRGSAAAVPLSDPASKLIYVLQHNLGWTAHRVSMRLNIPLMVVEECCRTGRASEILRHQLRNWLREEKENNTLPSELPSRVVHAVLNNLVQPNVGGDNDAQGGGAQNVLAAVDLVHHDAQPKHEEEDPDESFQSLDPLSRHHFDYLRKTVGCNFVSIITDPNDRRTAGTTTGSVAAWDWVENTVTSLLDDTPEAIARRRLIKAESVQDLFNLHPVTRDTFGPYLSYITPSYKSNWAEKQKMLEASPAQGKNAASSSGSSGSASRRRRTQQYSAQVRASQSARILPSNHPSSSSTSLPWPDWVPEEFFDATGFSLSTNLLQKLTPLIDSEDASNNNNPTTNTSSSPPQRQNNNSDDEPAPPLISRKEWDRVLSSTTPPPVPASLTTPLSSQQLTEEIAELESLMETIDGNMEDVNHCLLIHVLSHSEEFFHASQQLEALSNNSSTTIYDLRDTRTTVVRSGESVVGRFMQTLKLHRQRMHLQALIAHLDTLTSFLLTCRSISSPGDDDATTTSISKVVTTLQGAMKMRFKGDTSDTLADLKCIGTITTDLLSMHQQLQESVVRRCGEIMHPSTWSDHPIDWEIAGDYINAARECGTLRAVITRFQQDICDYCWEVVEEEISRIGGSATSPVVDTQQRFSAEGGAKQFSSGDPRAKRALLAAAVVPLKPQRYIHFVTDVTVRMSYYHSDVISQCDNLLHCLSDQNNNNNEGGGGNGSVGDSLDVEGLRAALLHSIQVVLIDVIECREAENAAMVFFDMMQLIRHVFQFVGTLQAADAAPSSHTRQSKSTIERGHTSSSSSAPPSSSSLGPLKAALASQARALFRKEHDRQQEKMLLVLGQETWVPNETVEQAYQRYCDLLCNSTPEAVAEFKKLAVDSTSELSNRALQHAFGTGRVATEDSEHFERKVYLTDPNKSDEEIVEQGFMVTTSLLLLLHSLYDYDRYLAAFPFLAPDVAMKIHDALKLFDGQCAGLVLGAGAVAQGTLDSISVQNLAVASQCTGFLIELAARIKLRLAAVTAGTTAGSKMAPFLKHLDRVQKDLTEHRNEYMAKVAAMVREKIDSTPFEPAQWGTSGSAWVMMMLKETARAHKHVKVVVRRADQQGFMVPIVGIVAQRLVNAIQNMPADALHGCRSQILSDLALVEANTVKFGYNAPLCMETRDVGAALSLANTNPAMDTKDFMRTFHPSLVA